jgi:hypothetical protein
MRTTFLLISFICATSLLQAQVKRSFRLPKEISEASGLVILDKNTLGWHNDSGNEPILYFTDERGKQLEKRSFPNLPDTDWEDITASPDKRLFIGNFGNNCNCRKDLAIYIVSDPMTHHIDSINFQLPDQTNFPPKEAYRNFDLEALFWHRDSLHLFTKNIGEKGNDYTKHYVLPDQPGQYVAELRDSIELKRRFISAAALSPDGERVALLGLRYWRVFGFIPVTRATVFVFSDFEDGRYLEGEMLKRGIRPYIYALQYEALDFYDDKTLVVGSEKTLFIRAKAKRLRLGKRFF